MPVIFLKNGGDTQSGSSGNDTITGGTGKYAGATGTLKVSGVFSVKGGDKETATFTMDVSGNIKTK